VTYRPAPRLEERSPAEVVKEIRERLLHSGLKWSPPDPPVEALIQIFGRYWELIAGRLNQALDKNFLTYLDYLGVSPIPATSAVVPLTFEAVKGAATAISVPARTQVAAAATDGGEPIVFETLNDLVVSDVCLRQLFSLDPATNTWAELSRLVDVVATEPIAVMSGTEPSDHTFFISDETLLRLEHVSTLTVRLDLAPVTPPATMRSSLEWFVPGDKVVPVEAIADGTAGLRRSGAVVVPLPAKWPEEIAIHGRKARWLACRVLATNCGNWSVSARRIEVRAEVRRPHATIDGALVDTADVDLSKDFYPFGARPAFGSTFYISSKDLFSHPGARVTLDFVLTNPHNAAEEPPIRRVYTEGHPRVWWEYWNGKRWEALEAEDATKAFRLSGNVEFQVPSDFAETAVHGRGGAWVRARLASGHYGEDERWELVDPRQPAAGTVHRAATLAPPSVQVLTASYTLTIDKVPDVIITSNERVYQDESVRAHSCLPFAVFGFPCGPRPALYLGVSPHARTDAVDDVLSLSLYVASGSIGPPASRSGADSTATVVDWQSWDGSNWVDFDVSDETAVLTRSGVVKLVAPNGARTRSDFADASPLFWFRVVPHDGVTWQPVLQAVLRNTVLAAHRWTVENEVLGSSHAAPRQMFEVLHKPVLEGELLQVREPSSTPAPADGRHVAEEGELDPESSSAVWKPWRPVDDFLSSTPEDRHYVIDRARGVIEFGDGQHGRIPPSGSNNVRLRRYESGGGARGNVAKDAANQLRSGVPSITKVANPIAASGGADVEPMARVRHRGATLPRHRRRAVTMEDYQDLALLASARVARAICVPLLDLSLDPAIRRQQPGLVSVIVVPDGTDVRPAPDPELLRQVHSHLDRFRNTATDLVVVGPDYVEVDVEVDVAVADANLPGPLTGTLKLAIEAFLHPLTGGPRGEGWAFGELPERSDLYALCASTPGVTWVNALRVSHREPRVGVRQSRQFLTSSGHHRVAVRYTRESTFRTAAGRSA
jgi:hypothetical protein